MNPVLIVKCETKLGASIGMIIFGFALTIGFGIVSYKLQSFWWLIGMAFGLFCVYHWANVIIKGGRTLVFYVLDQVLYFTFENTKTMVKKLEEIKKAQHYSKAYQLADIQNFWRYIVESSGATTTDILYFTYQGEKENLADLGYYEVKLAEADLVKIATFLQAHNPDIQIGK